LNETDQVRIYIASYQMRQNKVPVPGTIRTGACMASQIVWVELSAADALLFTLAHPEYVIGTEQI